MDALARWRVKVNQRVRVIMIQMKGNTPLQINKGQYVLAAPLVMYSLCMNRQRASRVHGGKVFFRDAQGHEHFIKQNSVMFVCDTPEECTQLEELSRQQRTSVMTAVRTILESFSRTVHSTVEQSREKEAA